MSISSFIANDTNILLTLKRKHNTSSDFALSIIESRKQNFSRGQHTIPWSTAQKIRVIGQSGGEFAPATRVLVLVLHARRPDRVFRGRRRPIGIEGLRCGFALGTELLLSPGRAP